MKLSITLKLASHSVVCTFIHLVTQLQSCRAALNSTLCFIPCVQSTARPTDNARHIQSLSSYLQYHCPSVIQAAVLSVSEYNNFFFINFLILVHSLIIHNNHFTGINQTLLLPCLISPNTRCPNFWRL